MVDRSTNVFGKIYGGIVLHGGTNDQIIPRGLVVKCIFQHFPVI